MEFNPNNTIVKRCAQGIGMEAQGHTEEAGELFFQAWNEATNDFEKYLAAYFVARNQAKIADKLKWFETALPLALGIDDVAVKSSLYSLYSHISECYKKSGNDESAKKNHKLALAFKDKVFDRGPFYHGTKADLKIGDFLVAGKRSNYQEEIVMNHVYFTALINGAGLAAALAKGDSRQRVYIVEPTGSFENDPNVTDKKFPGNLTRSYRTCQPLKIVDEVTDWMKQTPEDLREWQEKLENNKGEIIN